MEIFEILKAAVFGIVQGITEWLPISSTGHLILLQEIMPLHTSANFWSTFLVVIQLGSILAVLLLYWHKLNPFSPKKSQQEKNDTLSLWGKVVVAVIPAGIIGVLFEDAIDALFYNPQTIAITLILYGVLFILLENRNKTPQITDFRQLSYKTALAIGTFQVLSLVPGTSRSGSTILGAVFLGTSRHIAAEFSFFLAIPVMFGASFIKLLKNGLSFTGSEWLILAVGSVVSFFVSIVAIKFLISYIKNNDFKVFGYYRIVLGIIVFIFFLF